MVNNKDVELYKAAETAIKGSLRLREGEEVLIVTDEEKLPIAHAFAYHAAQEGGHVNIYLLPEEYRPYKEPTRILREAMRYIDVLIYMMRNITEEKPFRSWMVSEGRRFGRVVKMPNISEEVIKRAVNVDYDELLNFTKKVADYIRDAEKVEVTSPTGSNFSFSVKGRKVELETGSLFEKWGDTNLPAGEIQVSPVEETFNGVTTVDVLDEGNNAGKLIFEKGFVKEIQSAHIQRLFDLANNDPAIKGIGQFVIGTNPNASPDSKVFTEVEKSRGEVSVVLGDSRRLGKNICKTQYFFCINKATVKVNDRHLLKDGKFLFE